MNLFEFNTHRIVFNSIYYQKEYQVAATAVFIMIF